MRDNVIPFLVGTVTIVAAIFGLYVVTEAVLYAPGGGAAPALAASPVTDSTTTPAAPAPVKDMSSLPARLIIPALKIDANVQHTGVSARGTIGTPTNFTDVAWYDGSVVPGQDGSAFIDGHVDNGLGLAGVFKHLSTIENGDEIDVVTAGGATLRFKVSAITTYNYQNVPVASLLASSGTPTLQLVTCEGTWVNGQDTYNERLVVTAVLEK